MKRIKKTFEPAFLELFQENIDFIKNNSDMRTLSLIIESAVDELAKKLGKI